MIVSSALERYTYQKLSIGGLQVCFAYYAIGKILEVCLMHYYLWSFW